MPAPAQPELLREDYAELNVLFVHSRVDDAGLSVFAFRVYAHLARRASASGCAWPSIATIARVCRMGETKVREALRELVDRRLIDRQPRENQTYVFRLTPPSLWLPAAAATPPHREGGPVRGSLGEGGFAPRTPSPREPVHPAPPPPSPRAPEGSPMKEIADPAPSALLHRDPLPADPDRTAPESAARAASRRELTRTLPASLDTPGFRAAWEKWIVHWTLTFHAARGAPQPMPFATADAHLELCRRLGPPRAIAAIANAISRRLREPAEPFPSSHTSHSSPSSHEHLHPRPGNSRRFAQSGNYTALTDK